MRRTLTLVVTLVALLAIAAAGAWMLRLHLAQAWLERSLAARGYSEARFEVTAVDLQRLVIENLALSGRRDLRVGRVEAGYTPWALLTGAWSSVTLDLSGLEAELAPWSDARGEATTGGSGPRIRPALAAATRLASIRLHDAALTVASPVGPWTVEADGRLASSERGPEGELAATARNARLRVDGRLDAELVDGRLDLEVAASEDDGFRIDVTTRASAPWDRPKMHVEGAMTMPAGADLPWALLPGAPPRAGRLRVTGEGEGAISLDNGAQGAGAWVRRLAEGGWTGEWRVRGRGLEWAYRFAGLDLEASGELGTRAGNVFLRADGTPRLRVARIRPALRERLSIPAFARHHVDGPLELDWTGDELLRLSPAAQAPERVRATSQLDWRIGWSERRGRMRLQGTVDAVGTWGHGLDRLGISGIDVRASDWRAPGTRIDAARVTGGISGWGVDPSGRLDVSARAPQLAVAGLNLQGVRASATARLSGDEGEARLTVHDEAAEVALTGWRAGGRMRSDEPVRLTVTDAEWRLTQPSHWGAAVRVDAFAAELAAAGRLERLRFDPGLVRAGTHHGQLTVAAVGAEARFVDRGWHASAIEALVHPRGRERFVRFDIGRLAHTGEPAIVAPAELSGRLARNAGGYSLTGEGRFIDAGVGFDLDADYAPSAGAAAGSLELAGVRWRADGPQPSDLSPRLAVLDDVTGRTSARLRFRLDHQRIRTTADVSLEGVGFRFRGIRFEGVTGETRIRGARRPRSPSAQTLRIERIETAVPITDIRLRWRLAPSADEGLGVRVLQGRGGLLDGQARVEDERLVIGAALNELDVRVRDIALERLVDGTGIAGLRAQGRLAGRVPLSFGEPGLAVRDARLRGRDGHVALRSEAAGAALRAGGRDAELMLVALRDFAYDQIELNVDAPLGGRGRIDIRLDGRNPDVLSGEPLTYQIALTGAVTPLLESLAQGEALTDERIARHLDLRAAQ